MSSKPIAVTDDSFESDVLQSETPVLVDFWAPWCGPCRTVAPILDELAQDYAGKIVIAKVNTDESQAKAAELGVQGIPTMVFFKNGKEVDRVVGAFPKAQLASRITSVLGQA